ncbi:MAG: recombinase zinc beta ribbon domain-containing protein [Hyphomicrobiales bacterium]|nr:recombinase zinc beta ribbon domain-containing protein [Hyphomicrobiales bacterium]
MSYEIMKSTTKNNTWLVFVDTNIFLDFYLEAPSWGISRRKAQHEPIISLETYERIQERRNNNGYLPTRKDIAASFPLRGAVCCSSCGHPFTAGFSKGKYKHYPYYFCQQPKCSEYGKSIPKAKLESELEIVLKTLQPSEKLFRLVAAMFSDAWNAQIEISRNAGKVYKQEAASLEKEISQLVERVMKATSPRVIQAYESRIDVLENKRLVALEKAEINPAPKRALKKCLNSP